MTDRLGKRIGQRISLLRARKGLTAEQLAYQYGISKGYISDIENGKRLPTLKMLEKIARALQVDIKELF